LRESFFVSQVKQDHAVSYGWQGNFEVNGKYLFEIGGRNKSFEQIKNIPNAFIAADDIEIGYGNKIPLYLFGFLY